MEHSVSARAERVQFLRTVRGCRRTAQIFATVAGTFIFTATVGWALANILLYVAPACSGFRIHP